MSKTPKGFDVPDGAREDVMADFRKIAAPLPDPDQDRKAKRPAGSKGRVNQRRSGSKP